MLLFAIRVMQKDQVEVRLVMHFETTKLAVPDDRKVGLSTRVRLGTFRHAVLLLQ